MKIISNLNIVIFITKIRRDLSPLYLDAKLISNEIISFTDKNDKKIFLISEYPSLQKEIISYIHSRYGDFVLYTPPIRSDTIWLWVFPIGFLILLSFIFFRKKR